MSTRKATGGGREGNPSERTIFKPTPEWREKRARERRFEWVDLDDGASICVWANRVHEGLQVTAGATVPAAFGGTGEIDESALQIWTVQVSCRDGEPPDGELIFTPDKLAYIQELSPAEYGRIMAAIMTVNGGSKKEAERLQAFTERIREKTSPSSSTGASKSSVGSPVS